MKVPKSRALWCAFATCLATAAGLLAVSGPAPAATASFPVLATGQITFPAGSASGQVLVFADPNQATLKADTTDAALTDPLVASANAASDGSFTVSLDPAKIPASALLPDGSVNVHAVAVSGGVQQVFFFPVELTTTTSKTGTSTAFVSTSTGQKSATPSITFNMRGGTATNAKYDPAKWTSASGRLFTASKAASLSSVKTTTAVTPTIAKMAAAVASDEVDPRVCLLHPGDYVNGKAEHFVNVYDDGSTDTHIAEGQSSKHTLGIAVDTGGAWHQSGTASISRSASTSVTSKNRQHSWGYWNKVNYREFFDSCIGNYKKPSGFYDIISADIDGAVQYDFYTASCGQKAKGDSWDTTNATAATFGNGVSIAGIGVSAQSGYENSVNIHMTFLEGGSVRGTSGAGPVNSPKVDSSTFPC